MNPLKKILNEDIEPYKYLMSDKDMKNYGNKKITYLLIGIILGLGLALFMNFNTLSLCLILILAIVGYKFPFLFLKLQHNKMCNEMINAIPIWINLIYSLVGENNIYNSIVLSYDNVPSVMKKDLKIFIDKITIDNEDRDAYLNFLEKYNVDGFKDIMMKMFEFRKLSKENLKYEISSMNDTLNRLEKMKRDRRFYNELFFVDMVQSALILAPCLYMFFTSNLLSEMMF